MLHTPAARLAAVQEAEITSVFPGGNAAHPRALDEQHYCFEVDLHGGDCGLWFYFRITGAAGPVVTFDILNGHQLLGWPHFEGVRPVYGRPGSWRRVTGTTIVVHEQGAIRFSVPCQGETYVAFCYPYLLDDLERFRKRMAADHRVREVVIARPPGGRAVPAWEVGSGRAGVWLACRHHAGETPASYVLEGLMSELLAPRCAALLDRATFRICPMVDVDNVESGAYGKYGPPCDPQLDWSDRPVLPQIAALQRYFDAAPERARLFLDLHSPEPQGSTFVVTWDASEVSADYLGGVDGFCRWLHDESADPLKLDLARTGAYPHWYGEARSRSAQHYFRSRFDCLSLTLETSYHWSSGAAYPDENDYRSFGAALCRAVARQPTLRLQG